MSPITHYHHSPPLSLWAKNNTLFVRSDALMVRSLMEEMIFGGKDNEVF